MFVNNNFVRYDMKEGGEEIPEGFEDAFRTNFRTDESAKGVSGKHVSLMTNCFVVNSQHAILFHYRVRFSPPEPSYVIRKSLFMQQQRRLPCSNNTFDGDFLHTDEELPENSLKLLSKRGPDKRVVTIRLELVNNYNENLTRLCKLRFYDHLIQKVLQSQKLNKIGGNTYIDFKSPIKLLKSDFDIFPGYVVKIREYGANSRPLLSVDSTYLVMKKDNVLSAINLIEKEIDEVEGSKELLMSTIENRLIGKAVICQHNFITYQVNGIFWRETPMTKFTIGVGVDRTLTYKDYYLEKYGLTINNDSQLLLMSGPERTNFCLLKRIRDHDYIRLIPELCNFIEVPSASTARYQNEDVKRELERFVHRTPHQTLAYSSKFVRDICRNVGRQQAKYLDLRNWGLELTPSLMPIQGRELPGEVIEFYGVEQEEIQFVEGKVPEFEEKLLERGGFFDSPELKSWICVAPKCWSANLRGFLNDLKMAADGLNFTICDATRIEFVAANHPLLYILAVRKQIHRAFVEGGLRAYPELVFVMLPIGVSQDSQFCSAIKKICCIDFGIPVHFFCTEEFEVYKNLSADRHRSMFMEIAMAFCCKLGGEPWYIDVPYENMLAFGYATCPLERETSDNSTQEFKNVGALVMTRDENFGSYLTKVSLFNNRQEKTSALLEDFIELLSKWVYRTERCRIPPAYILFYVKDADPRDAFYFYDVEEDDLGLKLEEFWKIHFGKYGNRFPMPKLIFITVDTNPQIKIYRNKREEDLSNPVPGTVVDSIICRPEKYEFYLFSQAVDDGKAISPTHYHVISDTSKMDMDPDNLQLLTYKLCHTFYNTSGKSVEVPGVCKYAERLANFVGLVTKEPPKHYDRLGHSLYFL